MMVDKETNEEPDPVISRLDSIDRRLEAIEKQTVVKEDFHALLRLIVRLT